MVSALLDQILRIVLRQAIVAVVCE